MAASMLLLAFSAAATVLAQGNHAMRKWGYFGCSTVDLSCFKSPFVGEGESITPEMCQLACQEHHLAALFPKDCLCGDDASVVEITDERLCDYGCLGDPNHGFCGTVCPTEGPAIANVYTNLRAKSQVETIRFTTTLAPPVTSTSSEDCITSEQGPVTEQPPGSLITPVGTAPEIPTTFTFVLTSSSPAAITSHSERLTASRTSQQSSAIEEPTVVPPSTTCEEDPASVTPSSVVPTPYGTTTAAPPDYTSEVPTSSAQPVSLPPTSPQSYLNPYTSTKDEDPVDAASSTPDPSQDNSNHASTSTMWSRPSDLVDPTGQPPVPAQVPGSDSTHSMVPPLATIGGLALLAAIIM
ncbi:twinfilin-1 [Metarhizium rileyi]|uniref:Twinfilin-1 n=1 Tax=Metarhizium rileyi (strain RCEF 4871) TaxID=1649241 RepID=A0A167JJA2_METRR|nr:twinfilin-1 [Metarhizium rileyi RCEF 4871]